MTSELSDLVRQLGLDSPLEAGENRRSGRVAIAPYDESHADFFTHCYSVDNSDHLGYFVTKGWSPSIIGLEGDHRGEYISSDEYREAREIRHQNTLKRNSEDRYFFTILEEGRPIGYVSAVVKDEDGKKAGRISVMIGYETDCRQDSGSLALTKMLEVLAENSDFEIFDGKVEPDNNPSLRTMRKVFGSDAEETRTFENEYVGLDGITATRGVERQYFQKPREFFMTDAQLATEHNV
tara:strand:- start:13864 stop:14574 length:711 start_codon:yes stop_codon:yes gene_type:complete